MQCKDAEELSHSESENLHEPAERDEDDRKGLSWVTNGIDELRKAHRHEIFGVSCIEALHSMGF